MYYKKTYLTLS